MNERERHHDVRETAARAPAQRAPRDDDPVDGLRADADRLLRAADEAIERALSGDSQAFLEANRQTGGQ